MTVGEFPELAEMLLTDRDKASLLLIAARRGAVVPAVWRVTSLALRAFATKLVKRRALPRAPKREFQ
jgi:hypothetical protein